MKPFVSKFQIGKQGVTPGVVETLSSHLKNHKQVRISILKSASRDRDEMKKILATLEEKIAIKCSSRIIGFTIILTKLKE